MLEESGKSAETDMQQRALREEIVEAERTIQATQVALDSDGDLLNETERTAIEALMEVTKKLLNDDSTSAIHAAHRSAVQRYGNFRGQTDEPEHPEGLVRKNRQGHHLTYRLRKTKMPKITVLPHAVLCPDGADIDAPEGTSICDALLDNHIEIEHACGKCGACSTCHVIVKKGYDSLSDMSEKEEDMLDRAWGLTGGIPIVMSGKSRMTKT